MKKNSNKVESQLKTDRAIPIGDGQETQRAVALKAYELYEKAGRIDGYDVEHWLEAEKMVLAEKRAGSPSILQKASSEQKLLSSVPGAK